VERFPRLASPARRCIDNFAAVQRGLGTWWWPPAAQMMRGRELPPSSPSVGRNSEADDRGRPFFRQIRTSRVAVNQHSCQTDGALSATSSRNIARLHEVDLKQQRAFGPGAYSMVIIMRTKHRQGRSDPALSKSGCFLEQAGPQSAREEFPDPVGHHFACG
jgi:hypothetical protein